MIKNHIINSYEKLTGYSLSEDDPIVAISFIFQKIILEHEDQLFKKFILIIGVVGILAFLLGLSIGVIFNL